MALTQTQYIGRDLTITADGNKTRWNDYRITITSNTENNTAADDELDRVVRTVNLAEGSISGYVSADNNGGTLPQPGDSLDDFAVAAGSDSILPDLSDYDNIKVISLETSGGGGPNTWTLNFRSGVDN